MLDWNRIRELRDEIGEDDYAEIVEMFFAEVEETVARLGRPADLAERETDLHCLKGCALNLGFAHLGELCRKAEADAADGSLEQADVDAVLAAYAASRKVFEASHRESA